MRQGAAEASDGDNVKRRLLIVAIFLLAGAVVNVAVAWGCADFPSFHRPPVATGIHANRQFRAVARKHERPKASPSERYIGLGRDYLAGSGWDPPLSIQALRQGSVVEIRFTVYRAGLPLRSLTGDVIRSTKWGQGKMGESEPATYADLLIWGQGNGYRLLLFRPLWPGFAVNSMFYATSLWLLICGPFALRRFIRIRRGRCPACAYPRGEPDVCSECGKALPGRPTVAT